MDIFSIVFYLGWAYVLLSALGFAALLRAHQRQARRIQELEANADNLYQAGALHGYREATEQYRQSRPWQDGYEQGKHDGYIAARDELIAIAADTDAARQEMVKR